MDSLAPGGFVADPRPASLVTGDVPQASERLGGSARALARIRAEGEDPRIDTELDVNNGNCPFEQFPFLLAVLPAQIRGLGFSAPIRANVFRRAADSRRRC